jgi:hypothetical protein
VSTSSGTRSTTASRPAAPRTAKQLLKQRGIGATQHLRDALNIPPDLGDGAILGTALAEAAVREMGRNPAFGREVREAYSELMQLQSSSAPRPTRQGRTQEPLVPLRHTDAEIDPFAPPDPRELMYVYGNDKLGRALQNYTLDMLKQTADKV